LRYRETSSGGSVSRTSCAISRASMLSGTLIPPIAIGISVLPPNGGAVRRGECLAVGHGEPPILSPERFGIRAAPTGAKSLTQQYGADLLNRSGGKIN